MGAVGQTYLTHAARKQIQNEKASLKLCLDKVQSDTPWKLKTKLCSGRSLTISHADVYTALLRSGFKLLKSGVKKHAKTDVCAYGHSPSQSESKFHVQSNQTHCENEGRAHEARIFTTSYAFC